MKGDDFVDSPPPSGYIEWHEWAKAQIKAGRRQTQCKVCCRWLFPIELAEHKHDEEADDE